MSRQQTIRNFHSAVRVLTALCRSCVCTLAFVASLSHAAASPEPSAAAFKSLDDLVEHQEYDAALQRLNDNKASEEEKLTWLRRQGEAGHVPIQYDLAARLFARDRDESIKWYARGRLARTLDAAECASGGASFGRRVVLDKIAEKVRDEAVANPRPFTKAIEASLEWESKRVERPSAVWICGPAGVSKAYGLKASAEERRKSREDALRNMTIEAKAVRDFEQAVDAGEAMHVEVLDSGALPLLLGYGPPRSGWLDNRRLLFVGKPPSERSVPNLDKNNRNWAVLLWDTVANRIEPILWASYIDALCVDDDYVVVVAVEHVDAPANAGERQAGTAEPDRYGNVTWLYEGRYPNLVKNVPASPAIGRFKDRKMDCTEAPRPEQQEESRGVVTWLRSNDGTIFLPDGKGNRIMRRNDGRVITLPVSRYGFPRPIMFAFWKAAYLLEDGGRNPGTNDVTGSHPARGQEQVVHWLRSDGGVQTIGIPYGVWTSYAQLSAIRRGIVVSGGSGQNSKTPGYRGLYLFDDKLEAVRLIAGKATLAATSPDGCRLAFEHHLLEPDPNASGTADSVMPTMKMIDLCDGGPQNADKIKQ